MRSDLGREVFATNHLGNRIIKQYLETPLHRATAVFCRWVSCQENRCLLENNRPQDVCWNSCLMQKLSMLRLRNDWRMPDVSDDGRVSANAKQLWSEAANRYAETTRTDPLRAQPTVVAPAVSPKSRNGQKAARHYRSGGLTNPAILMGQHSSSSARTIRLQTKPQDRRSDPTVSERHDRLQQQ